MVVRHLPGRAAQSLSPAHRPGPPAPAHRPGPPAPAHRRRATGPVPAARRRMPLPHQCGELCPTGGAQLTALIRARWRSPAQPVTADELPGTSRICPITSPSELFARIQPHCAECPAMLPGEHFSGPARGEVCRVAGRRSGARQVLEVSPQGTHDQPDQAVRGARRDAAQAEHGAAGWLHHPGRRGRRGGRCVRHSVPAQPRLGRTGQRGQPGGGGAAGRGMTSLSTTPGRTVNAAGLPSSVRAAGNRYWTRHTAAAGRPDQPAPGKPAHATHSAQAARAAQAASGGSLRPRRAVAPRQPPRLPRLPRRVSSTPW